MHLWRINHKTGCPADFDATEFCVERSITGIGWRVATVPKDREDYWAQGKAQLYPTYKRKWSAAAKAVLYSIAQDDLIWTRNRKGMYYLGKLGGGWEYRDGAEYKHADIINVRPCRWVNVGALDNVPGPVISSFIPRRTAQRVKSPSALLYSRHLYASLRGESFSPDGSTATADILELLSADDLEDVAAVYLQAVKRFIMFPSTCKTDTMAVEAVFTGQDGQRVGLQVKRGNEPINRDVFTTFNGTVYLFQARGIYLGQENPRCVCLSPDEMRRFLLENRCLMPGRIQRWLDFSGVKSA